MVTRGIERAFPPQNILIDEQQDVQFSEAKQEPIAIVWMAVNICLALQTLVNFFPPLLFISSFNNLEEHLKIPANRFDSTLYTNGGNPGRTMKADTGNFIDGVDGFDHQ